MSNVVFAKGPTVPFTTAIDLLQNIWQNSDIAVANSRPRELCSDLFIANNPAHSRDFQLRGGGESVAAGFSGNLPIVVAPEEILPLLPVLDW